MTDGLRLACGVCFVSMLAACGDSAETRPIVDGGVDAGPDLDLDDDGFETPEDCDDGNPRRNPAAEETCNGIDDDCDGLVDDADDVFTGGETFHLDLDLDGFGDPDAPVVACAQPSGTSTDPRDCDDGNANVFPGAVEICNGLDDDCNSLTDDEDRGVVEAPTWYEDADADGFGRADAAVVACAPPEGHVALGTDCDDESAEVFPGAAEVCNGVDDDCDETTSELGIAQWTDAEGVVSDVTSSVAGTLETPASYRLGSPGTLTLCGGDYFVNLEAAADVVIRSSSGEAEDVTLDGSDAGPVVTVAEPSEVVIRGVTLAGGAGAALADDPTVVAGGALLCEDAAGTSTVELDGVVVLENAADEGGGLYADGCDVTATDSRFAANDATAGLGGGISLRDGRLTLTRVDLQDNAASGGAPAILLVEDAVETSGVFRSVDVQLHGSLADVGDVAVFDAEVTWFGPSGTGTSGIRRSTSTNALYLDGADFAAVDADFGRSGTFDDNRGPDILVAESGREYVAGDSSSFECDAERCGEIEQYDTGGNDLVVTRNDFNIANVYRASREARIESFAILLRVVGDCDVRAFLLSARTVSPGAIVSWTEEWSEVVDWTGDPQYWSTPDLGVLVERNRYYAFGFHVTCEDVDDGVETPFSFTPETDAGFGSGVYDAGWASSRYRTTLRTSSPTVASPMAIAIRVTAL